MSRANLEQSAAERCLARCSGPVAGGGKGAVIGAIAGAAAGAGVQILTRGKEVRVPAESQLTFRLDQPLRLQPARQ